MDVVVYGAAPIADGKPCGADFGISSEISGNVLDVTVMQTATRQGNCALTEEVCCAHHLTVELPEDTTVDRIHDLAGIPGRILFL